MKSPKILVFDVETAPNLAYVWGQWEQNVIEHKQEWYMLCWAAKWLGEKKMYTSKLNDYKLFNKDKQDDKLIIKDLWKLFNEADVIIGHNGDKFDIKKTNARFLFHGLLPPSPYKTIDTLKIARKYFKFNSNKLDDLGQHLGLGRKVKHEGFGLWLKCMNGVKSAWNKMIKYNKQDVVLLELVYDKFKPYMTNHPNVGLYQNKDYACPNCGSLHLTKRGFAMTKTNRYQRLQCQDCGSWSTETKAQKYGKAKVKN